MKKLVYAIVLGALVLSACGGGSNSLAATVDGVEITVGEVEGLMDTDGATATKEDFAQFLAFQIQWLIINASAEADYGIVISDEEAEAEATSIYEEVAVEGESREDFLSSRGVTEMFLFNIARQGLIDVQIREQLLEEAEDPTEDEIEDAKAQAAEALVEVCASHILTETEEEAEDVLSRLDDGEDFGELAVELSLDTTSGANNGILGCSSPSTYVEPFKEATLVAPVGEVYDEIVETQFGFHVILVTDRQEPSDEDLPTDEEIIDGLKDESVLAALEEWFLGAVEDADVAVEEEYGTWSANPPTVVPPLG